MDWKINYTAGFCGLGTTLSVYLSTEPTRSGAIRCMGPFGSGQLTQDYVSAAMVSLTNELENHYLSPQEYLVWGAYREQADYEEHKFGLMGCVFGFYPIIWLRSSLDPSGQFIDPAREWVVSEDTLQHRSGFDMLVPGHSDLDQKLFHPDTYAEALGKLSQQAKIISPAKAVDDNVLPYVSWARNRGALAEKSRSELDLRQVLPL